jgi:hypothetical protein
VKECLCWQSVDDIDWVMVRRFLHGMLQRFLDRLTRTYVGTCPVNLRFYVDVQDFIEIFVHDDLTDGSRRRLSDSEWDKDLAPLDSSFSLLCERLSEEDAFNAIDAVKTNLLNALSDECAEHAKSNFGFPGTRPVSWKTESS